MSWAVDEFEGINLLDKRLDQRAERLAEKPKASIPGACRGWVETQGAYRFFAQEELELVGGPGSAAGIEWVELEPGAVVVATDTNAWLHRPAGAEDPFLEPMCGAGTPATARGLLDGVIALAQRAAPRLNPPAMSLSRWAWRLAGYYHTTHATPILMAEAARLFDAAGRPELAAYARSKVADEGGHDELALRDLRALGLAAEAVVERWVPHTAAALVEHFTQLVRSDRPVRVLGYAYALERLALMSDADYIDAVEAVLPPGVHATRCLRVHSALGADIRHTEDLVAVAAKLAAAERIAIAGACYETARLCYAMTAEPPSDLALAEDLLAFTVNSKEVPRL